MTTVWPVMVSVRHNATTMSAQSSLSAGRFRSEPAVCESRKRNGSSQTASSASSSDPSATTPTGKRNPETRRGEGYGIWLTGPSGARTWLGFFQSADKQGRLLAQGALRKPIAGSTAMLVSREAHSSPAKPGHVYLRGAIQRPSGG